MYHDLFYQALLHTQPNGFEMGCSYRSDDRLSTNVCLYSLCCSFYTVVRRKKVSFSTCVLDLCIHIISTLSDMTIKREQLLKEEGVVKRNIKGDRGLFMTVCSENEYFYLRLLAKNYYQCCLSLVSRVDKKREKPAQMIITGLVSQS